MSRFGHVQFGRTVCGGIFVDQGAKRSCETLDEDMKWYKNIIPQLQVDRDESIVYANNNDIFVIGGYSSVDTMEAIGDQGISSLENVNNVHTSTSTMETIRASRSTTMSTSTRSTGTIICDTKLIKLQQKFLYEHVIGISNFFQQIICSASCGIQHGEDLIITGGRNSGTDVYKYSILENGNMKTVPLPSLHNGRYSHGCTSYKTDDNIMVNRVSHTSKIVAKVEPRLSNQSPIIPV